MKYLFIDNKIRKIELEYFKSLNYEVILIPSNSKIYDEISSHTDIHLVKLFDKYVVSKELYEYLEMKFFDNNKYLDLKEKLIIGNSYVIDKYPLDIPYNIFTFKSYIIHNFKYTDLKCLDLINNIDNVIKIDVKQGYTNCSCVNISDEICITSDLEIYNKLKELNTNKEIKLYEDIVYIDNNKCDIKLIKNSGEYSNMDGFIGGCMSYIENKLIIFGDKKYINDIDYIEKTLKKHNIDIIDFKNLKLIDYGKAIEIKE